MTSSLYGLGLFFFKSFLFHTKRLNNRVVALLKSPKKDMEQVIKAWTAAIEGAKALQSEQRFSEALLAYEIMQGIWSNEERLTNLHELTEHW